VSLKADKDRTPEQHEQFKQEVIREAEADRLMMAQEVSLFIVGVPAHYITPWGGPPVTGRAFARGYHRYASCRRQQIVDERLYEKYPREVPIVT
jgi:hypothetical protein